MNLDVTPSPTPSPMPATYGTLSWNDPLVQVLVNVIRALAVLAAALLVARFAKVWVVRLFTRSHLSLNIATLLGNLVQVLVVTVGVVLLLPSFGVDWTGLLTLVGAAGLAISLSMQDLLKNVIAGIYILMEQPFRIGDRISIKEVTGSVQGIELRTTILCTDDNLQVVVPNSTVLNEIVTNRSVSDLQRQAILVYTAKSDMSAASGQISSVLKEFEGIASSPAPVTSLEQIKDGMARLRVEFWVESARRITVTSEVAEALRTAFPDSSLTVV